MSNIFLNRNQTNILPRINSKLKLSRSNFKNKNSFVNNNNNLLKKSNNNLIINSLEKKPGTSIDKKKPLYFLPKIQIKKLSNTAGVKTDNLNNVNNNFYYKQFAYQKENENNNEIQNNNKMVIDYENYEKSAIELLNNDDELKNMYEEIYNHNNKDKKEWIEENLFKREVFIVMLESYIKQNKDVISFIKNEINKILNNQLLDKMVMKSFKQINFQYDEYISNIYNL